MVNTKKTPVEHTQKEMGKESKHIKKKINEMQKTFRKRGKEQKSYIRKTETKWDCWIIR